MIDDQRIGHHAVHCTFGPRFLRLRHAVTNRLAAAETNGALSFDRAAAQGMRLNIASGTAVRFEPGQQRTVELVDYAGDRKVYGFRGMTQGNL
ncbi:MAG: hypothetical protein EON92_17210 [Burkholderiales bacterium]|nr:MAG: hypothetical protein EON92_17210 [Burkholderiales bacterium]